MDIWCQHVKWKKPSQHCLKCLLDEVEWLKAEKNERIIEANSWMGHCLKLRKALEYLARRLKEPVGPRGQEECRNVIDKALKGE